MTDKRGIHYFSSAESAFAKDPVAYADMSLSVIEQVAELFVDETASLPFHIRTGQQAMGDIAERKRFKYLEFHGCGTNPGTLRVKVYIDGRYICDGQVTLSETPDKRRRLNIPIGNQLGYAIDVEFAGNAMPRAIEFAYEGTLSTS